MSIINIIMAAAGNTSTGPWDLAGAGYVGEPFPATPNGVDAAPSGVFFKPDGLKMFVCGFGSDAVYEYTLSVAWSVGTAVYTGVSFSAAAQDTTIKSMAMSSDGTAMFLAGDTTNKIYQYTLGTAWSLATASYASKSKDVTAEVPSVGGLAFNDTGTAMYVSSASFVSATVYQYTLATAWDVSTATYALKSFAGSGAAINGIFLASSGTKLFMLSTSGPAVVYSYNLGTADDVTTAVSTGQSANITYLDNTSVYGLFIAPTGDKMYVAAANVQERVFELAMSTAYNLSTATFAYQLPDMLYLGAQLQYPTGMYLTDDGLNVYFTRDLGSGSSVTQYAVGTAWDLQSSTYSGKAYSIAAQDSNPGGISMSADMTKMFVFGQATDKLYLYNLGTPGDVTTASYSGTSFSVATQSTSVASVFFAANGLYFYAVNPFTDLVYQYNLSVAWDLTTATYSAKSFSVVSQAPACSTVYVSPDGAYMYAINGAALSSIVYEYAMTTAFDISTAYYTSRAYDFSDQETAAKALFFKPDGLRMYLAGSNNRTAFQYSLGL